MPPQIPCIGGSEPSSVFGESLQGQHLHGSRGHDPLWADQSLTISYETTDSVDESAAGSCRTPQPTVPSCYIGHAGSTGRRVVLSIHQLQGRAFIRIELE